MGKQRMRPVDGGFAFGQKTRIGTGVFLFRRHPGAGGIPFQEETPGITAGKKTVRLPGDRVPLAKVGTVDPAVRIGIVAEETSGKRGATADGFVGRRGEAHHVGAFGRVIEIDFMDFIGIGIFNRQRTRLQIAGHDAFSVREVPVEESLAACYDRFFVLLLDRPDRPSRAFVEFEPACGVVPAMSVDLPVEVAIDVAATVDAFVVRQHGLHGPRVGLQADNLAGSAADTEIDPSRIVGRNRTRVLPPVLLVDVAVVPEGIGTGIVTRNAAIRVGGRPDAAVIVFGHAHGHLRHGLVAERKRPFDGVEGQEVAVKMGAEKVAAGEN